MVTTDPDLNNTISKIDRRLDERLKNLKGLHRRSSDKLRGKRMLIGLFVIMLAVLSKAFHIFSDWPALILGIMGGLMITDEHITDAISAWRRSK